MRVRIIIFHIIACVVINTPPSTASTIQYNFILSIYSWTACAFRLRFYAYTYTAVGLKPSRMFQLILFLICLYLPYSETALQWEKVQMSNSTSPDPRRDFGFGYWEDERDGSNNLVVFGGRLTRGRRGNDVWLFNILTRSWRQLSTNVGPARRFSMVSGVYRNQSLFVLSMGQGPSESDPDVVSRYSDVWALDLTSGIWNELVLTGSGISARYGGHGGIHRDSPYFWVGGGFSDDHQRYSDTFRINLEDYDHENNTQLQWELINAGITPQNQYSPAIPHARCLHGSTMASPQDLVIFGGCMRGGRAGGPCPTQDSWHYSLAASRWTQLPFCSVGRAFSALAPLPQYGGDVVVHYGGIDAMNRQILALEPYPREEVMVLNLTSSIWTRVRAEPDPVHGYPERREGHGMVATDSGVVYMFGGRDIENDTYFNDVWILRGNLTNSVSVGGCSVLWLTWLHLHGLCNALAWLFVLPCGVLVARYYKKPGSAKWFWAHRILQVTGVVATLAAAVMAFATSGTPSFPHAILGILILIMAVQQPVNGFLRPHKKDNEPKKKRRVGWEAWHKTMGYLCIALGFVNCILGSLLIIAPYAVWICVICMVAVWVALFLLHEVIHSCKQTYDHSVEEVDTIKHELISVSNPSGTGEASDSKSESTVGIGNESADQEFIMRSPGSHSQLEAEQECGPEISESDIVSLQS